jgi:hypothetical protein
MKSFKRLFWKLRIYAIFTNKFTFIYEWRIPVIPSRFQIQISTKTTKNGLTQKIYLNKYKFPDLQVVSCLILKVKALQISVRITIYFQNSRTSYSYHTSSFTRKCPFSAPKIFVRENLSNLLKCLTFKHLLFLKFLLILTVKKMEQIVLITLKQTIVKLFQICPI